MRMRAFVALKAQILIMFIQGLKIPLRFSLPLVQFPNTSVPKIYLLFYRNISALSENQQNESCFTLRVMVKFQIYWCRKRKVQQTESTTSDKMEVRVEVKVKRLLSPFCDFLSTKFLSTLEFPTTDISSQSRNFLTSHMQHWENSSIASRYLQ